MSSKKNNSKDIFTENTKSGEIFVSGKEASSNVWSEDFVYRFEDNKVTNVNDVGKTGTEDNEGSAAGDKTTSNVSNENKDNNRREQNSDSGSSESASSSSSSSASASSSTAGATASSSVAGTISTVAAITTTAVVFVVGGGIVLSGVESPTPQIVEFEHIEASVDTIHFSILIGNDIETIKSGEEKNECYIDVELTCDSYKEFKQSYSIRAFGEYESVFEDLYADTEYTVNVVQTDFAGIQTSYLIEPMTVKTEPAAPLPKSITLNTDYMELAIEEEFQIEYFVEPEGSDASIAWMSDDDDVATVTQDGLVTAVGVGETIITATAIANPDVIATMTVKVYEPAEEEIVPTSLSLNAEEVEIMIDETYTLFINAAVPSEAVKDVTWSSSNEEIATVVDGEVTGVAFGECTVTATSTLDENVSVSASISVTKKLAEGINLKDTKATLDIGEEFTIEATVAPETADQSVAFESNNTEIATVDESGLVTAVASGSTTITVTSKDPRNEGISATFTVTVRPELEDLIIDEEVVALRSPGDTHQLSIGVYPEGANDNILYSSEDENVATVDETGLITAVEEGETTIIVQSAINEDLQYGIWVHVGGPTYEMYLSRNVDAFGNYTYNVSFDVMYAEEEDGYAAYALRLSTMRGDEKYEVATAPLLDTDLSQKQAVEFDGSIDHKGTYIVTLLGSKDGTADSIEEIYEEEIDFSSLEENEIHSNQLFLEKINVTDINGETISSFYQYYVDSDEEISESAGIKIFAVGDTSHTNQLGQLDSTSFRTMSNQSSLYISGEPSTGGEYLFVVYTKTYNAEQNESDPYDYNELYTTVIDLDAVNTDASSKPAIADNDVSLEFLSSYHYKQGDGGNTEVYFCFAFTYPTMYYISYGVELYASQGEDIIYEGMTLQMVQLRDDGKMLYKLNQETNEGFEAFFNQEDVSITLMVQMTEETSYTVFDDTFNFTQTTAGDLSAYEIITFTLNEQAPTAQTGTFSIEVVMNEDILSQYDELCDVEIYDVENQTTYYMSGITPNTLVTFADDNGLDLNSATGEVYITIYAYKGGQTETLYMETINIANVKNKN